MVRSKTLSPHVGRLSRSQVFAKRGLHKGQKKSEKPAVPEIPPTKEVTVGGERNGSTRIIPTSKAPRYYPAEDVRKPKKSRKTFVATKLRSSITPGTVLILLAGRFRGKRVVFLKQLESGLLLVTGPFRINGVPLRRVNQAYVIATSTKIDFEGITVRTNFLEHGFLQPDTFIHVSRSTKRSTIPTFPKLLQRAAPQQRKSSLPMASQRRRSRSPSQKPPTRRPSTKPSFPLSRRRSTWPNTSRPLSV